MTENRILFVNGLVFDGTGSPAVPADVVVRGDRVESVRPGGGTEPDRAARHVGPGRHCFEARLLR